MARKLFVECFQESEGGRPVGKLIHKGNRSISASMFRTTSFSCDRLCLPPPEFRASPGSQFENPATPEAGPFGDMPRTEPAFFEAAQAGRWLRMSLNEIIGVEEKISSGRSRSAAPARSTREGQTRVPSWSLALHTLRTTIVRSVL